MAKGKGKGKAPESGDAPAAAVVRMKGPDGAGPVGTENGVHEPDADGIFTFDAVEDRDLILNLHRQGFVQVVDEASE